jgi:hypothetical protein
MEQGERGADLQNRLLDELSSRDPLVLQYVHFQFPVAYTLELRDLNNRPDSIDARNTVPRPILRYKPSIQNTRLPFSRVQLKRQFFQKPPAAGQCKR